MYIIGIIISLLAFQTSTNNPVFILDLDRVYDKEDDSEFYKYITRSNLETIKIEEVKNLRFNKKKKRKVPSEIRRFKYIEELDLGTEMNGMHVRWMSGVCEFIGHHEKGKLKKLPIWLLEFKNLKRIHLEGQVRLNVKELFKILEKLEKLEELTLEIKSNDILVLNKLVEFDNLKKLKIQLEDMNEIDAEMIEGILADKGFEYELKSINRNQFKK